MASGCETIRGRIDAVIGQASALLRPHIIRQRLTISLVEQPSKCEIVPSWQEKNIVLKKKRLYRFLSAFTNGQDCEELKELIDFLLQYNKSMRSFNVEDESDSNDEELKEADTLKIEENNYNNKSDKVSMRQMKTSSHNKGINYKSMESNTNKTSRKSENKVKSKNIKSKRKIPVIASLSKEELLSKASKDAYHSLYLYEDLKPYFNDVDHHFHEILHKATSYLMMECSLIKIPSEFNIVTRRVVAWFLEMKACFKILCEERTRWERKQDIKARLKKEILNYNIKDITDNTDDDKNKEKVKNRESDNRKETKEKIEVSGNNHNQNYPIYKNNFDSDEAYSLNSTTSSYIEAQRIYTPLPKYRIDDNRHLNQHINLDENVQAVSERNKIPKIGLLPECCSKKINKSNGNIIYTKDRAKTEDTRLQRVMSNISTGRINIDERKISEALGVKSKTLQKKANTLEELSELQKDIVTGVIQNKAQKSEEKSNEKEKEVIPLTNNNKTTSIFPITRVDDPNSKNVKGKFYESKEINPSKSNVRPIFFNELCSSSLEEVDYEKELSAVVENALKGWTSKKTDLSNQKGQSPFRKKMAAKLWNLQMGLTNSLHIPPDHRNSYVLSSPSNENPWDYQFHLLGANNADKSTADVSKLTSDFHNDQNGITTPTRINKENIQDFLKIRRESKISPLAKELKNTRDHLFQIRANAEEDEIARRQEAMNETKDRRQIVEAYKVDEASKAYSTTIFSSPRESPVKSPKPKELARIPMTSVPIETMYLKHELNERGVSLTPRSEAFAIERKNLLLKPKPSVVKQHRDFNELLKYHFLIPNSESVRHENQRHEVSKIMACFQKWIEKEDMKIAQEEKDEMDLLFNSDDDSTSIARSHVSDENSLASEHTEVKASAPAENIMSPAALSRLRGARQSVFGRALMVPQSNPTVTCRLNFPELGDKLQDDPHGMGKRVLLTASSKKKGKGKKGKGKKKK